MPEAIIYSVVATLVASMVIGLFGLIVKGLLTLWKRHRETKVEAAMSSSSSLSPSSSIPFPIRRPDYSRTPYAEYKRSRMR